MTWVVTSVSGWVWCSGESLLKTRKVGERFGGAAVDFYDTVLVLLHGVLVCETTGIDTSHLSGVESSNLTPITGVCVATVLGKAR